jgi:hypothetical protein
MLQSNFEKLLEKIRMHNNLASLPLPGSSGCRTRAAFLQHFGLTPSLLAPRAKNLTTPQIYRQKLQSRCLTGRLLLDVNWNHEPERELAMALVVSPPFPRDQQEAPCCLEFA